MRVKPNSLQIEKVIISVFVLMNLFVPIPISTEPLNLPRMTVVGSVAFGLGYYLFLTRRIGAIPSQIKIVSWILIFDVLLIQIFGQNPKIELFYGVAGSNLGTLSIISILIIFLTTVQISTEKFALNFIKAMKAVIICSISYSTLQAFNLDPINWNNSNSQVIGFLGNPNFQSAILGFGFLIFLSELFKAQKKIINKISISIILSLTLFLLGKAASTQGFIIVYVGTLLIVYFHVRVNHKKLSNFVFAMIPISLIVGALDILRLAPWNTRLYEVSISARGDFWRAAIRMTLDHPFFGVGFDKFRDNYFLFRDENAVIRPGAEMVVRSSHNYFLDWASLGGLPFLLLNVIIFLFTGISSFNLAKKKHDFANHEVILVVLWIGFLIQSLVSVQQLGVLIWGWIISGLIIGLNYSKQDNRVLSKPSGTHFSTKHKTIFVFLIIIGFFVVSPPMYRDIQFRNSIETGNIEKLIKNSQSFPKSTDLINESVQLLLQSNNTKIALDLSKYGITNNPQNYTIWKLYSQNSLLSSVEQFQSKMRLQELDPKNQATG